MPRQAGEYVEEPASAPAWIAADTIIISALLIVAAITRFWHLGHPAEIVFDEVHFVAQGRHYLHGESFLDPHPPLAKLVIAAGHPHFRRSSVELACRQRDDWHRAGGNHLPARAPDVGLAAGRCDRGRDHPLRRDVPGRFALRRNRHRLSHLRGSRVPALFQIRTDARHECAPAHPAVDRSGAGLVPGQQTLHPGDNLSAGDWALLSMCSRRSVPIPRRRRRRSNRSRGRVKGEESQSAARRSRPAIDLFDQTSASSLLLTCIVLGLLLFLSGVTFAIHSADRFRSAGNSRCRDFLAQPLVIGGAAVADAIAGERPRTDERWRSRARRIGRRDCIPGGVLPALLARLVGRHRRISSSTTATSSGMRRASRPPRIRTRRDGGAGR